MRWIAVLLGVGLVAAALGFAGEKHRENCIDQGRESCSVLPWDEGDEPPPEQGPPTIDPDIFEDGVQPKQ